MKLWDNKIEWEAISLLDKFWATFTPTWFKWIGWTTALGGLSYLCEKVNSKALWIVYGISYISFFMYFQVLIGKIVIQNSTEKKVPLLKRIISLLAAIIVLFVTIYLINHTLQALKLSKI
jgi:hypothetical protein